jgi:hypothetical protein
MRTCSILALLVPVALVGCAGTAPGAPTRTGPPPEYEEETVSSTNASPAPTASPNPAVSVTAGPAPAAGPTPGSDEGRGVSTLQRELSGAFAAVNGDFSKCYDAELARAPDAKGRMLLRVVVSEIGLVTESRAVPGHSFSKAFEECVLAIPPRLKFGKSTTATAVTLPLDFARP